MISKKTTRILIVLSLISISCSKEKSNKETTAFPYLETSNNILDYNSTPKSKFDKSSLMFSDQGAWFAFGLQGSAQKSIGFSGPFLLTQENGVWLSSSFTNIGVNVNGKLVTLKKEENNSYSSHLEQNFKDNTLYVSQKMVFVSGHTALIQTKIQNNGSTTLGLELNWKNSPILADGISLSSNENQIQINSNNTTAKGYLIFAKEIQVQLVDSTQYKAESVFSVKPNETKEITLSQTFIFPEYSWKDEKKIIDSVNFDSILDTRKKEKNNELKSLIENRKPQFQDTIYAHVLAKSHLTLQNNWRIPAGEIKHEGLFPSYHYEWFNGFWSWDSWKHAVGLSYYNIDLAKNQMRVMFDFQSEDGFIVDCVYRDTTIEAHNYRDTKPPLSAWAVAKIYEKDKDIEFVKEFYPKLKKYHEWWYSKRDHDQDGLCEYGSTDGTLTAAKWESGMDNAIRFDASKILKNEDGAYSLNQESVDLNAYLYAEKLFLATFADALQITEDVSSYKKEATILKIKIQQQFYDTNDGWFYDTTLNGNTFIKGEGSEGWTALWANAATQEQAEAVKNKMMDTTKFYTKIPFQTMSADHSKFDPLKGYWRGPNWLDQSYFGVKSLRNYGFNNEADKATIQILAGAEGLLEKGLSIRENYHPLTGEGLHAHNFGWSAAHVIMFLTNE